MKTAILGLHAETSIHAGAGATLEVVDLPVQREAPTGWPCVFGSAVKGALRACAVTRKAPDSRDVELVFGPDALGPGRERTEASEYAGALLVGDARLALLPVRSLTGHFKWVTCPAALERFQRDAARLGLSGFDFKKPEVPPPKEGQDPIALAAQSQDALFLEEYRFAVEKIDLRDVVAALARLSGIAGFDVALGAQLVVAHDDDFAFLTRHATPVTPHVAIDSTTKTTYKAALWYEETLPPETLLYVCLAAHDARKDKAELMAEDVLGAVKALFSTKPYLQLGGNETVGMGWCKTNWVEG